MATTCQLLCHSRFGWSAGVPPCPLHRETWTSPSSANTWTQLKTQQTDLVYCVVSSKVFIKKNTRMCSYRFDNDCGWKTSTKHYEGLEIALFQSHGRKAHQTKKIHQIHHIRYTTELVSGSIVSYLDSVKSHSLSFLTSSPLWRRLIASQLHITVEHLTRNLYRWAYDYSSHK